MTIFKDGEGTHQVLLSPRELQVVRAIGLGKTGKEIAAELGLAENTVRWRLHRLYLGLHLRGRAQLTIWWANFGSAIEASPTGRGPAPIPPHRAGCPCLRCEAA